MSGNDTLAYKIFKSIVMTILIGVVSYVGRSIDEANKVNIQQTEQIIAMRSDLKQVTEMFMAHSKTMEERDKRQDEIIGDHERRLYHLERTSPPRR